MEQIKSMAARLNVGHPLNLNFRINNGPVFSIYLIYLQIFIVYLTWYMAVLCFYLWDMASSTFPQSTVFWLHFQSLQRN